MTDKVLEEVQDLILEDYSVWTSDWDVDESDPIEHVTTEAGDHGRWVQYQYTVVKHKESGRYFAFNWQSGLTENQDDEGPDSRYDIHEAYRKERTVVQVTYESKP